MSKTMEPIISGRIRIVRNFEKYKFPLNLDKEQETQIEQEVQRIVSEELLMEQPQGLSIILGQEDHIQIECTRNGLILEEMLAEVNKIDDVISENMEYAYDEKYGYLTSCITNLGTGMRASVLMHLPGLGCNGNEKSVFDALGKRFSVKSIKGEEGELSGHFYEVFNQDTLGITEVQTIESVKSVALKIAEKELAARRQIIEKDVLLVQDRIFRSMGIIENAKIMSFAESMDLLSNVMLGVDEGFLALDKESLIAAFIDLLKQEITLDQNQVESSKRESEIMRAERLRRAI